MPSGASRGPLAGKPQSVVPVPRSTHSLVMIPVVIINAAHPPIANIAER